MTSLATRWAKEPWCEPTTFSSRIIFESTASTFFDPPLLGGTKRFIFPPKLRFRRFFTQNRRYTQVRLLMEARADTSSPCAIWGGYRDTYSKHYGLSRIGTHNESPSATKIDLCEKKDGGWVGSEPNTSHLLRPPFASS